MNESFEMEVSNYIKFFRISKAAFVQCLATYEIVSLKVEIMASHAILRLMSTGHTLNNIMEKQNRAQLSPAEPSFTVSVVCLMRLD